MEKGTLIYVALGLLVWAVSGTLVAGYYFVQYDIYSKEYRNLADTLESVSITVDLLISYGNETKIWYNGTILPLNSTAFTAIQAIADIEYKDYGGDLGILVTSINGVTNNQTHGWLYWYWDVEDSRWIIPEFSSAKYVLHRNDIVAYTYVNYATWPPPPPT